MSVGFGKTTINLIDLPPDIPDYLPYAIDDCTTAFHLGFRNKTMWYVLNTPEEQYKVVRIPKKKKGTRIIHAPTDMMKLLLRQLLIRFIAPLQDRLGPHVTAYRKGMSVRDAVAQHIPHCAVCEKALPEKTPAKHDCPRNGLYIHIDLRDFFPSNSRTWIRNYFKTLGYSHEVAGYLANLVTVRDIPNPKYRPHMKDSDVPEFYTGVPQGSPASGAICNLIADQRLDIHVLSYLDDLNTRMKLKDERKWAFTRYSDDMSFTCGVSPTIEERHVILHELFGIITHSGYRVHKKKTKMAFGFHRRTLLGMVFNQHPNFAREDYLHLRAVTHNCLVHGFESQCGKPQMENADAMIDWLRGKIGWVKQINTSKGDKLLHDFLPAVELHKQKQESLRNETAT